MLWSKKVRSASQTGAITYLCLGVGTGEQLEIGIVFVHRGWGWLGLLGCVGIRKWICFVFENMVHCGLEAAVAGGAEGPCGYELGTGKRERVRTVNSGWVEAHG